MGLDMYLNARRYLSEYDENDKKVLAKLDPITKEVLNGLNIKEIVVEAMNWRKANAVHKWFVDNVQNGVDDCGYYYVDKEKLQQLLDTVNKVLGDKKLAGELLPPQSGFFFGGIEFDDWYWDYLKYTQEKLSLLLEEDEFDSWNWGFEYHSSW